MKQLRYAIFGIILTVTWLLSACGGTSSTTTPPVGSNTPSSPGKVRVLAFDDLNGNGIHDPSEPGIQAQVGLATGTSCPSGTDLVKAKTGADGMYLFSNVKPGAYCVGLLESSLRMTSPLGVAIKVTAGQESSVNFAVLASR